MQKDALNNVHIANEQVLITPEELKKQFPLNSVLEGRLPLHARLFLTSSAGKIIACWWCAVRVPFTIPKRLSPMRVT